MAENGRLKALPDVLVQFVTLKKEYEKLVDVCVISPRSDHMLDFVTTSVRI